MIHKEDEKHPHKNQQTSMHAHTLTSKWFRLNISLIIKRLQHALLLGLVPQANEAPNMLSR